MKHVLLFTILASFFSLSAFAEGQVSTECPMMKEQNRRVNTKLNLDTSNKKPVHVQSGSKAKGA